MSQYLGLWLHMSVQKGTTDTINFKSSNVLLTFTTVYFRFVFDPAVIEGLDMEETSSINLTCASYGDWFPPDVPACIGKDGFDYGLTGNG